jgi:ATP-dependent helicase YprA (DUF1998 family)
MAYSEYKTVCKIRVERSLKDVLTDIRDHKDSIDNKDLHTILTFLNTMSDTVREAIKTQARAGNIK